MKRIILSAVLLLVGQTIFAQTGLDKGSISFNLGYDAGAHLTLYDSEVDGNSVQETDTSGAVTSLVRFNAQYNVVHWFSVGLDVRGGSYLEDPENMEADGNTVNLFALSARFYPVNKPKFNWFIGTSIGRSNLEINRKTTIIVPLTFQYKFSSGHFGLETGFNWYFVKSFGVHFNLGYMGQQYVMNEYRFNNEVQDLGDMKNTLQTSGVNVGLGVSFYF